MEREVSQLVRTGVSYKERLFVGNVHLVCPHHKLLDLIGSWDAPNRSTLQAHTATATATALALALATATAAATAAGAAGATALATPTSPPHPNPHPNRHPHRRPRRLPPPPPGPPPPVPARLFAARAWVRCTPRRRRAAACGSTR